MKQLKNKPKEKKEMALVKQRINPRGRSFEGKVIRIFGDRITMQFERFLYLKKYERYEKRNTKLQAKIPLEMRGKIFFGDYVEIKECRPLSKSISFVLVKKIRSAKDESNISKSN